MKEPKTKVEFEWKIFEEENYLARVLDKKTIRKGGLVDLRTHKSNVLEFCVETAKKISADFKCELITLHKTRNLVSEDFNLSLTDENLLIKDMYTVKMGEEKRTSTTDGNIIYEIESSAKEGVKVFIFNEYGYFWQVEDLREICKKYKVVVIVCHSHNESIEMFCKDFDFYGMDYDKIVYLFEKAYLNVRLLQSQGREKLQEHWKKRLSSGASDEQN